LIYLYWFDKQSNHQNPIFSNQNLNQLEQKHCKFKY